MSVSARHGAPLRLLSLAVAGLWWIATLGGRLRRGDGAIVLCYHGVTPAARRRFAAQMRAIEGRAVQVADLDAPSPVRRPRVCVTFDDAFANLLENALPAAAAHGVPVAIFAVTGSPGTPPRWAMPPDHPDAAEPTMDAEQLRAVASRPGCTLGSHSVSHRPLTALAPAEAAAELMGSRERLQAIAGVEAADFAFPHGAADDESLAAAAAAGYTRLHTLDGASRRRLQGALVVGRTPMSPGAWPIEFRLAIDGAYAWLPAARRLLRPLRRGAARRDSATCPEPAP